MIDCFNAVRINKTPNETRIISSPSVTISTHYIVLDGMDISQIDSDSRLHVRSLGKAKATRSNRPPPMSPHALVDGRAIPKNYGAIFKAYYIEKRFRVYSANLYSGALNALRTQLRGLYDD